MLPNQISGAILDAAIAVHRRYGPGLLESLYENALAAELSARGLQVEQQRLIHLDNGEKAFYADLIVNDTVICELKSVDTVHPIHKQQLLTYLRLANKPLGLLLNFNVPILKRGIHRIVNNLPEK